MAVRSPIILSSPPKFELPIYCSSSPDLPPASSLFKKRSPPNLKTGSRATSITDSATAGFHSARTLRRDAVEETLVQDEHGPRKRRKRCTEQTVKSNTDSCEESKKVRSQSTQAGLSPKSCRLGRFTFEQHDAIDEDGAVTLDEKTIEIGLTPNDKNNGTDSKYEKEHTRDQTGKPPSSLKRIGPVSEHFARTANQAHKKGSEMPLEKDNVEIARKSQTLHSQMLTEKLQVLDAEQAKLDQDANATNSDIGNKIRFASVETHSSKDASKARPLEVESTKDSTERKWRKAQAQTKSSRTVTSVSIAQYKSTPSSTDGAGAMGDKAKLGDDRVDRARLMLDPGGKAKPKEKKPKKKEQRQKLLDPDSAQLRLERQDVFFGTSSQLTRDESVLETRQIQRAIKEYEAEDIATVCDDSRLPQGRLWNIGSRDNDLLLLEAEELPAKTLKNSTKSAFPDFIDFEEEASDAKRKLKVVQVNVSRSRLRCTEIDGLASSHSGTVPLHAISLNVLSPKRQSVQKGSDTGRAYTTSPSRQSRAKTKEPETTEIRPRGRPRKGDTATKASPKKTKGKRKRGKKEASDDWPVIDEIEDTEETAGASRNKPKLARKDEREEFLATKASKVFPTITEAIKRQQKVDPSTLTWHEKMLLYDPIILEDLTEWLKSRPIKGDEHDYDDEEQDKKDLTAWMVQLWCEEHSVCCLWKEGLRGGVKAKY